MTSLRWLLLIALVACSGAAPNDTRGGGVHSEMESSEGSSPERDVESAAASPADPAESPTAQSPAQEGSPTEAAAASEPPLVVFLEVKAPFSANQSALVDALRAEGAEAEAEGTEEVVLIISQEDFERRFAARIGTTRTGASSSSRIIEVQTLERYRVPRELRRFVASVYFDPQR